MHSNIDHLTEYKFFSFLKIHYLLALYFFCCSFSIAISQIILFLVALLWFYGILKKPEIFAVRKSSLDLWILSYIAISIIAIIFSSSFSSSISHAKNFFVFLIFFFGVQALTHPNRIRLYLSFFIAGGVVNCFYALFRYIFLGEGGLEKRLHGFISSWMTFSSFMMMILLVLLAKLIWRKTTRNQWLYLFSVLLFFVIILLTLTRSSWVGLFFGVFTLTFLHSRKLFLAVLLLLIILGIISYPFLPDSVTKRFRSIFDTRDTTNKERIYMATIAVNIIKAHPLLGIGPGTLRQNLHLYVSEGIDKNWNIPHLHNNILQIAVDKGLLGLLVWLCLYTKWFYDSLLLFYKNKLPFPDLLAGAIAVIVAFLISGLFEYNFGDSEILMTILFFMSLPYALKNSLSFASSAKQKEAIPDGS